MNSTIISNSIVRARWKLGLTMHEAASRAGVRLGCLAMAESGSLDVDMISLFRIIKVLELDFEQMFAELAVPKPPNADDLAHVNRMRASRFECNWRTQKVRLLMRSAINKRNRLLAERREILLRAQELAPSERLQDLILEDSC